MQNTNNQHIEKCFDVKRYFHHIKVNKNIDCFFSDCTNSEYDIKKIISMINTDELPNKDGYIFFDCCAVTEDLLMYCKIAIERLSAAFPKRKLFLCGCGVNYDRKYFEKYGTALSNDEKFKISNYGCNNRCLNDNINENNFEKVSYLHTDIYSVKISDGCYNNCSYCIVHKIRPFYTAPYDKIKKRINAIVQDGGTKICIIGTDLASYNDNGMKLSALVENILKDFPEIEKVTVEEINPSSKELDKLIELAKKETRLHNVFSIATQCCSDSLLKRMRRTHNANRLIELHKMCENSNVNLAYQLIVGFPGETEEEFQETCDFIKNYKPAYIDTAIFSARKGTDAYDYPNKIPYNVAIKREKILHDIANNYSDSEECSDKYVVNEDLFKNTVLSNEFLKLKNVHYIDISTINGFKKAVDVLNNAKNNTVICVQFSPDINVFSLDVGIKLLRDFFENFEIVIQIDLNDIFINFLHQNNYTLGIFYKFNTIINIKFSQKLTVPKDVFLHSVFSDVIKYNLVDTEKLLKELYESGNEEYYDYINNALF